MSFCTCVATSLRSRSSLPPRCAFRFAHSLVVCATSTKPPFLQGLMALMTAQLECWEHADAEAKLRPRTSFRWPSPFYETGNTRCEGRHHRSTSWMHQLHGGMRLVALCRRMWQHITAQNDEPMKPQNELAEQLRWQIHGHFGKFLSHCHLVGTS